MTAATTEAVPKRRVVDSNVFPGKEAATQTANEVVSIIFHALITVAIAHMHASGPLTQKQIAELMRDSALRIA